jgi:hypothetical protein
MAINTPKILAGIKGRIPNITSNRAISSILDTIANEDEQFLPSTPPGYKTRYPEFKFTNTRWKGFKETKKDLPFKKTVQYLIKAHPNIAQSVFAVMFAEAAKRGQAFKQPGGNNFAGVQTDNAKWGAPGIIGQYARVDSGNDRRAFAMFDSHESFLNFMANRIANKKFPSGNDPDKWTQRYLNSWVYLNLETRYPRKYKSKFPKKRNIYNSAISKFNSLL